MRLVLSLRQRVPGEAVSLGEEATIQGCPPPLLGKFRAQGGPGLPPDICRGGLGQVQSRGVASPKHGSPTPLAGAGLPGNFSSLSGGNEPMGGPQCARGLFWVHLPVHLLPPQSWGDDDDEDNDSG